ncbi:MAG TPA: metalloregulator ArsR/SmtB family transcription factor [Chthoniobacterales bacterium]|jgi:predicted ArsR family transcriptional regulator|nr:metalloregulator ArsR/SmtB family transcription factor [Chthoniobacterales bacterium]
MSSHNLEKSPLHTLPPADRLLFLLKTRGPQAATQLAVALKITPEAARQQLLRLSQEGLVAATTETRGVGRPSQVYSLTSDAQKRFPDTHAQLTVHLIESIKEVLGQRALDKLIAARGSLNLARYAELIGQQTSLRRKIKKLAEIRTAEGYMASWHQEGEEYVLVENHCPICAAATACVGFCHSELETFREVLGPGVEVERTEHLLAGARRCAYRIASTDRDPVNKSLHREAG